MTLHASEMTGRGRDETGPVQALPPDAVRPRCHHRVVLRHPFNHGGAGYLRKKLELAIQGNPARYGKVMNEPQGKDQVRGPTLDQALVFALRPPAAWGRTEQILDERQQPPVGLLPGVAIGELHT